ncbi:hypothetical protein [Wolbachia endosymbiont of Mansonella perstans]|uniref:hypothetical protein n=1 Tax=Wolbachia endosymbiont of Mansonella perstans TaxID=229526 RepID=UPI001CE21905|nr:hypothetical protein [Wolbachia endosymbiont of Mansonella perstans]MCA4774023.1 hypothetical protein [Wolbachia endosymbiont of Mansonella perstans]
MKVNGANNRNLTDHRERRECDSECTERKCQTYAIRKKPIIVTDEDKEDRTGEEQQLVKGLEDYFKRIENLKTKIPENVDDVNKCSFPSH